jgi:hypothetical protein
MPSPLSSLCQCQMAGKIKKNQTDARSDIPQPDWPWEDVRMVPGPARLLQPRDFLPHPDDGVGRLTHGKPHTQEGKRPPQTWRWQEAEQPSGLARAERCVSIGCVRGRVVSDGDRQVHSPTRSTAAEVHARETDGPESLRDHLNRRSACFQRCNTQCLLANIKE